MDIAIGVPNTIKGTTGPQLLEWARRAEAAGFSSLSTIGAVSYPGYEELTYFAAAGAITERIRFMSNVMIAPARSTAELAKQAATVQELTDGRLTLGIGVGWRESDYVLTGRPFHERGRLFDEQVRDLERAWAGEALAPGTRPVVPEAGRSTAVPLVFGGTTEATIRRVVDHGAGWAAGGVPPEMVGDFIEAVRTAWRDAGKAGAPRITALNYFSLGDTEEASRSALLDYYEPMGDMASMIAEGVLRTPEAIKERIDGFAALGVDELYLDATVSDPGQVDLLAEVALA
jgi:alkanesulfonate monooxygenase SsuD/methylene tetrahydromethanopterin reductase-like flavin-dependent oxidoreductase (luciferase family)